MILQGEPRQLYLPSISYSLVSIQCLITFPVQGKFFQERDILLLYNLILIQWLIFVYRVTSTGGDFKDDCQKYLSNVSNNLFWIFHIQMEYPSAKHVYCIIIWQDEPRQLYLPSIPCSLMPETQNIFTRSHLINFLGANEMYFYHGL